MAKFKEFKYLLCSEQEELTPIRESHIFSRSCSALLRVHLGRGGTLFWSAHYVASHMQGQTRIKWPGIIVSKNSSYSINQILRFQNTGLLGTPRVCKSKMGARALNYQVTLLWNHLSVLVYWADTLPPFTGWFKTFLFDKANS